MNDAFFKKNENEGFKLFQDFNQKLKIQDLTRAVEREHYDASGHTSLNEVVEIEIKKRNLELSKRGEKWIMSNEKFTADTVMIESHKLCSLLLDYQCNGIIPLYVNFFNNDYVVVYNLSKFKSRPEEKTFAIYSNGYQFKQFERRAFLKLKEGWIYKKENDNYKLVQKGFETFDG